MSEVLGLVGMSHSPFATLIPPATPQAPGGRFLGDVARVAAAVRSLDPDAIVVIGPDHFHANFYDVMPPFALGVEQAVAFGDFGTRSGTLPVAAQLAWSLRDGLDDAGFDIALSYSLTVDHGIVQGYEMLTSDTALPMVPLVINTAAPPLPTLARCVALGHSLGDALRAATYPGRVLVLASGGLSHWLPSNDPRNPDVAGERRDALIHGRHDIQAFTAAREPRVKAMGGNPDAPVAVDFDTWFLKQLGTQNLGSVIDLGHDGLEQQAGSGGHEIRSWLTGMAAVRAPLAWTSYEAVPEWITGMGIGTTFPVP